jgi:hypothetical protein
MSKKSSSELRKLLYDLQTPEERDKFSSTDITNILNRFDRLYVELELAFEKRDSEFSDTLDSLIEETDKKIKSYLDSVVENTDSKIEQINSLIGEVESKTGSIEVDLRSQIKGAKEELNTFSNRVLALHATSKEETIGSIKDAIIESKKAVKDLESRTDKILYEIDGIKRDFIERMSHAHGGGSMNQRFQIDGTTISSRYADINFVGSGWSATNNNTTKQTDITVTSGIQQPTSGVVNGVNATFVWSFSPTIIVVDQGRTMQKVSSDGTVNWTGTTTTVLTLAPNFDIFAM